MPAQHSVVYMHHSLLVPSSVDGRLGRFHVLALEHGAAVKIWARVSFQMLVSTG